MTAQLQPLDHALIAVLRNKFKRWLNLEMAKDEGVPPKFAKICEMTEILYGMRPEIGKYCWNNTIFKGKDEVEVPEEIVTSFVEVQE